MNINIFKSKILELENVFNAKYTDKQAEFLWKTISKWREPTFLQVVNNIENNFKPAFNVPLPLPAHFNEIRAQLNIQEEQEWKNNIPTHEPIDDIAYEEYKKQVSKLMVKWTGDEDFKLKTPYIDGIFCCELCHRTGCNGKTENELRNGCPGFLSSEKNDKIIRESNYQTNTNTPLPRSRRLWECNN